MNWQTITKENNLTVSEITLEEVLHRNRFDAEFYSPLYLDYEERLSKKGYKEIKDFAFTTDGIHASIDFDKNSNINLLSAMSPKDNYFDISNNKTISEVQHKKNPRTELKEGDVIVSTVGTIGNSAVVDKIILPANSDRHLGIIRIKSDYLPHFLSTFLLSKYGKFQTLREATGNVQLNLFIEKIDTLKVPVTSDALQKKISDTVKHALNLRQRASLIYVEAEQQLLKELNLVDYTPSENNVSVRSFREALIHNRFDAEYWQPKYDEMEERVFGIPQKKLSEIVSIKKGVEVGSDAYGDEGRSFVRVSDFSIYGVEEAEKRISEELYKELKEKYRPRKGEVLFTKDGTIGLTYALDEDVDVIVSGAFLRFKLKKEINNKYFALVLNSIFCKAQIERMSGGAIITHLKPGDVKKINIPLLPKKRREELGAKVTEAFRLRNEANTLLEKAKQSIEIFIEQNEKQSLLYLNK